MQKSRLRERSGFSLIELLIVIAIILILAAIAVPKYADIRMSGYETGAIQAITTIHTGETQYFSQFGRYATSLQELGPPTGGASGPQAADLIPGDLATGTNSGYKFTLTASPTGYIISAMPIGYKSTGRRSFYADQSMSAPRNHWGPEAATAEDEPIGAAKQK